MALALMLQDVPPIIVRDFPFDPAFASGEGPSCWIQPWRHVTRNTPTFGIRTSHDERSLEAWYPEPGTQLHTATNARSGLYVHNLNPGHYVAVVSQMRQLPSWTAFNPTGLSTAEYCQQLMLVAAAHYSAEFTCDRDLRSDVNAYMYSSFNGWPSISQPYGAPYAENLGMPFRLWADDFALAQAWNPPLMHSVCLNPEDCTPWMAEYAGMLDYLMSVLS